MWGEPGTCQPGQLDPGAKCPQPPVLGNAGPLTLPPLCPTGGQYWGSASVPQLSAWDLCFPVPIGTLDMTGGGWEHSGPLSTIGLHSGALTRSWTLWSAHIRPDPHIAHLLPRPHRHPPPHPPPLTPVHGFSKSCTAPESAWWGGRGARPPTHRLVCRPGLCSQGLGNSHVLSHSGASGLSLGSLLFLPKQRGNYSSALASWPSSATRQRGLGQGRRPAVDDPAILWVAPPDQSWQEAEQKRPHPPARPSACLSKRHRGAAL